MTTQEMLDELCDLWDKISHHYTDYETLYSEEREEAFMAAMSALEDVGNEQRKTESEGKSMLHNVTVKHEENKVLEWVWVMRAVKENKLPFDFKKTVIDERKLDHEPSKNEIAQFLSDSGADFVSVVQNYGFASELPF